MQQSQDDGCSSLQRKPKPDNQLVTTTKQSLPKYETAALGSKVQLNWVPQGVTVFTQKIQLDRQCQPVENNSYLMSSSLEQLGTSMIEASTPNHENDRTSKNSSQVAWHQQLNDSASAQSPQKGKVPEKNPIEQQQGSSQLSHVDGENVLCSKCPSRECFERSMTRTSTPWSKHGASTQRLPPNASHQLDNSADEPLPSEGTVTLAVKDIECHLGASRMQLPFGKDVDSIAHFSGDDCHSKLHQNICEAIPINRSADNILRRNRGKAEGEIKSKMILDQQNSKVRTVAQCWPIISGVTHEQHARNGLHSHSETRELASSQNSKAQLSVPETTPAQNLSPEKQNISTSGKAVTGDHSVVSEIAPEKCCSSIETSREPVMSEMAPKQCSMPKAYLDPQEFHDPICGDQYVISEMTLNDYPSRDIHSTSKTTIDECHKDPSLALTERVASEISPKYCPPANSPAFNTIPVKYSCGLVNPLVSATVAVEDAASVDISSETSPNTISDSNIRRNPQNILGNIAPENKMGGVQCVSFDMTPNQNVVDAVLSKTQPKVVETLASTQNIVDQQLLAPVMVTLADPPLNQFISLVSSMPDADVAHQGYYYLCEVQNATADDSDPEIVIEECSPAEFDQMGMAPVAEINSETHPVEQLVGDTSLPALNTLGEAPVCAGEELPEDDASPEIQRDSDQKLGPKTGLAELETDMEKHSDHHEKLVPNIMYNKLVDPSSKAQCSDVDEILVQQSSEVQENDPDSEERSKGRQNSIERPGLPVPSKLRRKIRYELPEMEPDVAQCVADKNVVEKNEDSESGPYDVEKNSDYVEETKETMEPCVFGPLNDSFAKVHAIRACSYFTHRATPAIWKQSLDSNRSAETCEPLFQSEPVFRCAADWKQTYAKQTYAKAKQVCSALR